MCFPGVYLLLLFYIPFLSAGFLFILVSQVYLWEVSLRRFGVYLKIFVSNCLYSTFTLEVVGGLYNSRFTILFPQNCATLPSKAPDTQRWMNECTLQILGGQNSENNPGLGLRRTALRCQIFCLLQLGFGKAIYHNILTWKWE